MCHQYTLWLPLDKAVVSHFWHKNFCWRNESWKYRKVMNDKIKVNEDLRRKRSWRLCYRPKPFGGGIFITTSCFPWPARNLLTKMPQGRKLRVSTTTKGDLHGWWVQQPCTQLSAEAFAPLSRPHPTLAPCDPFFGLGFILALVLY